MRSRLLYLAAFTLAVTALVIAASASETGRGHASTLAAGVAQEDPAQAAPLQKRHLFTQTVLHRKVGNQMQATGIKLDEQTFEVVASVSNLGGYDWVHVVNRAKNIDGWIFEHLTSAVPAMQVPANGVFPIGQERVDRWAALPHNYKPSDLVNLDMQYCRIRQIQIRREAAEAFVRLHKAARQAGHSIFGFSGYRSYDMQRQLYLNRITIGELHRQRYVARPGHTEHQLGTVVDVVGLNTGNAAMHSFDNTPEANWLRTNCYEYGFVLSYGPDNRIPTGYGYESWHIRYIGKAAVAEWIRKHLPPGHAVARRYAAR